MKNSCMTILSIWEILDYVEISSVENEVQEVALRSGAFFEGSFFFMTWLHVHEWMQLFISGCLGNILY